ncbi:cobalamin biosynthesis protein CobD [Patescibacteria group bacterium]|nr:cobalamin biosynthesis protein CobD [Patescibacteria group bacterium]
MLLVISSYIADLVFGDPEGFAHPVRGMGRLINFLDDRLRGNAGQRKERMKGAILTLSVMGISACFACLFIELSRKLNPFLGNLAWVYLGYCSLSVRDLRVKAKAILKEVEKDSIVEARRQLSKIVGRDTQNLSKEKITAATIESIAESANDGIVAPLIYLILGGPVLAFAYKSINTLDSMVGYRNEEYLRFGWFAAKVDDIANFIPARISGFLLSISSIIVNPRNDVRLAFKTMLRDGRKHPSPNSGVSIAAMAAALGVRLGGPSTYQGKLLEKPYLGKDGRPARPSLINEALAMSFVTSLLMLSLGVLLKWVM